MAYESVEEELKAMLNGTHVGEFDDIEPGSEGDLNLDGFDDDGYYDENEDENDSTQDGLENGNNEGDASNNSNTGDADNGNFEDTNTENENEDNSNSGSETNDQDDGSGNDTDKDNDEASKENDAGNSQDGTNTNNEGNSETNDKNDGSNQDTAINYKDEYEKLKAFYEKVTGEFKANGKTIKGFSDPEKIIQGLQKAIGFEEKNAVINKHKKLLAPLRDRGMLDDEAKFNLALSIIDGDPEAIKQHLKNLELNPALDLDLDEINYTQKQHIASDSRVVLDDAFETAKSFGVDEKLNNVLSNDFDDKSFREFIDSPRVREDLITHIQDGTYDLVKERMDYLRSTDMSGDYKSLKSTDQYRYALNLLVEEYTASENSAKATSAGADGANSNANVTNSNTNNAEVNNAKAQVKNSVDNITSQAVVLDDNARAKILAEEEAKFREETRKKLEADAARKEAASVSRPKAKSSSTGNKTEEFDPLKLAGDDFRSYFNTLMR